MCVDYRRVNAVTRKDSFPLPRIDDALDALAGSAWYCTIDLVKGYHQIPVRPSDVEKTAFVTHDGLFEYLTMPFGLCNAPGTCQRLMYMVLEGLIGKECLSYIDDVLIFASTRQELLARLSRVLKRLREAGLKIKPSKCKFFEKEVTFLGHRVSSDGVRPDDFKIRAVMDWPEPTTVKQLQGFLGLVNYFSRYIPKFAQLVAPLYERTKCLRSKTRIELSSDELESFLALKNTLINPPLLAHPRLDEPFILQTDGSKIAVGAVLLQAQPDGSSDRSVTIVIN